MRTVVLLPDLDLDFKGSPRRHHEHFPMGPHDL